jgi:hypothetical protein
LNAWPQFDARESLLTSVSLVEQTIVPAKSKKATLARERGDRIDFFFPPAGAFMSARRADLKDLVMGTDQVLMHARET